MAHAETGMGRAEDKVKKNLLVTTKTPGPEDLEPQAVTGDEGMTVTEYAPYGVIGSITPTTNPTSTIINNSIAMIAAGNAVTFNVHPSASPGLGREHQAPESRHRRRRRPARSHHRHSRTRRSSRPRSSWPIPTCGCCSSPEGPAVVAEALRTPEEGHHRRSGQSAGGGRPDRRHRAGRARHRRRRVVRQQHHLRRREDHHRRRHRSPTPSCGAWCRPGPTA